MGVKIDSKLYGHILGNGSIVLLLGSFAIGAITGQQGLKELEPFIVIPFTGFWPYFCWIWVYRQGAAQ